VITKTFGPILLGILLIAAPGFSQDVECADQSVAADLTTTAVPSAKQCAQPSVALQQPVVTTFSTTLPQTPRIVTASQANGTYRYRQNEIKILALGHNKLRIQMDLTYEYKSAAGPMANSGEASGEATIENDTAVFYPSDNHSCKITIKFLAGNTIKVSEENTIECGFGMNVSSEGTYTKIKAGKPRFDEGR
jgi:hypothetical protein